jgi:putative lipoprotein
MPVNTIRFASGKTSLRGAPMWAPNRRAAMWGRPCKTFFALAMMATALALGACGKKGDPEPPNPQTDHYPRQYPDPSSL